MTILDAVETGHERVSGLRTDLDRVRVALDRTDAMLGATDEALDRAGDAIRTGRRWGPVVLTVGVGLLAVGAVTIVLLRRRRRSADPAQD